MLRFPRNSKQHFIKRHFFTAHKSRMGVPSWTSSAVIASVKRRLLISNLPHSHIRWSIVLYQPHTHIASSTILNLQVHNDIILDTVETNFLSSLRPVKPRSKRNSQEYQKSVNLIKIFLITQL
jgi:hypothetical protein